MVEWVQLIGVSTAVLLVEWLWLIWEPTAVLSSIGERDV